MQAGRSTGGAIDPVHARGRRSTLHFLAPPWPAPLPALTLRAPAACVEEEPGGAVAGVVRNVAPRAATTSGDGSPRQRAPPTLALPALTSNPPPPLPPGHGRQTRPFPLRRRPAWPPRTESWRRQWGSWGPCQLGQTWLQAGGGKRVGKTRERKHPERTSEGMPRQTRPTHGERSRYWRGAAENVQCWARPQSFQRLF